MFLKISMMSFGGGYGMLSMIMDEGKRMISLTSGEFADMTGLDMICSGPIALNGSTFLGYLRGGLIGSMFATAGCIIPSVVVCIIVLIFLEKFYESRIIKGLFEGIKPACGGLLLYTGITLFKSVFFNAGTYSEVLKILRSSLDNKTILTFVLAATALIMDQKFKIDPLIITILGAVFGLILLS